MPDSASFRENKRAGDVGEPGASGDVHPSMAAAMQAYIDDPDTPSTWDRAAFDLLGPNRGSLIVEATTNDGGLL